MRHSRSFAFIFDNPESMLTAVRFLTDKRAAHNISSLSTVTDDEGSDEVQCESIHTGDVDTVVVRPLTDKYVEVRVWTSFELEDDETPIFGPYNFDGEYDLPKLTTFMAPDECTNPDHWYPSPCGEPYQWGEESV